MADGGVVRDTEVYLRYRNTEVIRTRDFDNVIVITRTAKSVEFCNLRRQGCIVIVIRKLVI